MPDRYCRLLEKSVGGKFHFLAFCIEFLNTIVHTQFVVHDLCRTQLTTSENVSSDPELRPQLGVRTAAKCKWSTEMWRERINPSHFAVRVRGNKFPALDRSNPGHGNAPALAPVTVPTHVRRFVRVAGTRKKDLQIARRRRARPHQSDRWREKVFLLN